MCVTCRNGRWTITMSRWRDRRLRLWVRSRDQRLAKTAVDKNAGCGQYAAQPRQKRQPPARLSGPPPAVFSRLVYVSIDNRGWNAFATRFYFPLARFVVHMKN